MLAIIAVEETARLSAPKEDMRSEGDRRRHLENAGHGYPAVEASRLSRTSNASRTSLRVIHGTPRYCPILKKGEQCLEWRR